MNGIQITHDERGYHVIVDGVDLAAAIAAGGLKVEWVPGQEHPHITMTMRPHELNAHLPEATLAKVEELSREVADERVSQWVRQAAPQLGRDPDELAAEYGVKLSP